MQEADQHPPGSPDRDAAQRRAARLVAVNPGVLDLPALAGSRPVLARWARLVPFLLSDEREAASAAATRAAVGELLGRLHRLDADPATSCATVTSFLRGLDAEDADARATADREAHRVTAARAPEVAAVLTGLAGLHAADDRERSSDDWRRRMAVVNGTQVTTLRRVQAAVAAAGAVAAEWRAMRAVVVGGAWSDRRAGLPAPQVKLETHAAVAAAALGAAVPALAGAAVHEAGRVRAGDADRTVVEADGRVSATWNHRPTPRGGLVGPH